MKMVCMTSRRRKYMAMLLIAGLLAWAMVGVYHKIAARAVDRTNALQVTKPVTAEPVLPVASPDFFTEYRLERDKIRSERSEILREIMKNATTDEARNRAQEAMLKLVQDKQRETEMENLIKARGFLDALIFTRDNAVSAIVKTTALSREEALQVADIISRVSGVKAEDITISVKP